MSDAIGNITIGQYREELLRAMQACGIPRTTWDGLTEYILQGRPIGGFLQALLSNDLTTTVKHADDLNAPRFRDYIAFLEAVAPATCWGTPEAVREWMRRGGLIGINQQAAAQKSAPGDKPES